MSPETAVTARPGYPHKGHTDKSWLLCPNCGGAGAITQERAIMIVQAVDPKTGKSLWDGPGGTKGETCLQCNGVGRIHDPGWPSCPCGGAVDPATGLPSCHVCHGLGKISPEKQGELDAVIKVLQGELEVTQARLKMFSAARKALR